jgi:ferrous iron transport protein B
MSMPPQMRSSGRIVALGGNPNVGKSTVFNALTSMNQHTGNWPGKTVGCARGHFTQGSCAYELVDLPGTYSLMTNSAEEEIARDFLSFSQPDVTIIVADATCLERNLNLALQVLEVSPRAILCVNLLDEAKKKHIRIVLNALSRLLDRSWVPAPAAAQGLRIFAPPYTTPRWLRRPYAAHQWSMVMRWKKPYRQWLRRYPQSCHRS